LSSAASTDDGGAVLVVVEDRNAERFRQPLLDLDAPRRRDVLEVGRAEYRRDPLDDHHDLLDVLRVEADREGIDAAEPIGQDRLALHHGKGAAGADVPETHRGAIRDHGDHPCA
jgi:hypothetical protein